MKRTLIVGWRPGNIADAFAQILGTDVTLYIPDVQQMDLLQPTFIYNYLTQYGPFDEIVYCAGINELEWIKDLWSEDLHRTYQVNVFGLVEIVARHVEIYESRPFRVVALVSDSSRHAMRGSLAYSSSKAALVGVIKNMARELAPRVLVVGVSPGIVEDTPMTDYIDKMVPGFRGWNPEKTREYEQSMIPMRRRATKYEVAQTMLFALRGPDYLTGSIIEIAGGK